MPAGPAAYFRQGCMDGDAVNAFNAQWTALASGLLGYSGAPGYNTANFVSLTVNGALPIGPPLVPALFQINKAGVLAESVAAPVVTTDDGKMVWIVSNTNNAHVVTFTGNTLQAGVAGVLTATFAAFAGAGMLVMALQGKWVLIYSVGVTVT